MLARSIPALCLLIVLLPSTLYASTTDPTSDSLKQDVEVSQPMVAEAQTKPKLEDQPWAFLIGVLRVLHDTWIVVVAFLGLLGAILSKLALKLGEDNRNIGKLALQYNKAYIAGLFTIVATSALTKFVVENVKVVLIVIATIALYILINNKLGSNSYSKEYVDPTPTNKNVTRIAKDNSK